MFTVTHLIQAVIQLSTCCEASSNERTLSLRSYHMHHLTLALSTINLSAASNISCRKTQQGIPSTTHKAAVHDTPCLFLNPVLVINQLNAQYLIF